MSEGANMIERLKESGSPLSLEEIREFEEAIGMALPDEYARFLLTHNGGIPVPNAFPIRGFKNNPFGAVQVLFRIGGAIESSNLDWNYEIMNGRLPANLIAIGCTGSGDLICLSLFGENTGEVMLWDFYGESSEVSDDNIYHVADSFEEFLEMLQTLPLKRDN